MALTPSKIIGLGDSIMVGSHANGQNFIHHSMPHFGWANITSTVNLGAGGSTMEQTYNSRVSAASRRDPSLRRNVFFIHSGTNDIAQYNLASLPANAPKTSSTASTTTGLNSLIGGGLSTPTPPVNLQSAGQQLAAIIYQQRLIPLVTYLRGLGPDVRVVVNSVIPRLWRGTVADRTTRENARLAYNEILRANASAIGIFLADIALLPDFGPTDAAGTPIPTLYVGDRIHLRSGGYALCCNGLTSKVGMAWMKALEGEPSQPY